MKPLTLERMYPVAWIACAVTLPWPVALNNACLILLVITWAWEGRWDEKWRRLKSSPWVIPFLALLVLYAMPVVLDGSSIQDWNEIERRKALLLPVLAASGMPWTAAWTTRLLNGFTVSCVVAVLVAVVLALAGYTPQVPNFDFTTSSAFHEQNPFTGSAWDRLTYIGLAASIDQHPVYFSMYLVFASCILMVQLRERISMVQIVMVLVLFTAIMLLSSRAAILLYALVMAVLLFQWARRWSVSAGVVVVLSFIVVLVVATWSNRVARFRFLQEPQLSRSAVQAGTMNSVASRELSWTASWDNIRDRWLLGYGPGGAQIALDRYYLAHAPDLLRPWPNAHNQYLQTWLEVGIMGLLLLLASLMTPLLQGRPMELQGYLFVVLVILCVSESLLTRQKGIVFFGLFYAIFLATKPRLS